MHRGAAPRAPAHRGYLGRRGVIPRDNNFSTTNAARKANAHRQPPQRHHAPALPAAPRPPRGPRGPPHAPTADKSPGPGSAKRRRFQRGFPGRKTRRGPAEERGGLPAPLRCKSGGGAGGGGGGEGKKRRRRRRGRLLPAEERPGPAPVRPVGPRGGAPGSCSGRSESFCVQVAERRGLFALQQLSHYLH